MSLPIIEDQDIVSILEEYNAKVEDRITIEQGSDYWNILKNLETKDFCAVPGSGKTTILALKLAILLKKWKSNYSGICIISHTNAAKDEIIKKLSVIFPGFSSDIYPHFVGTIQEFVDKFLALPYLRSIIKDFEVNSISGSCRVPCTKYVQFKGGYKTFKSVFFDADEKWYLVWNSTENKCGLSPQFQLGIGNISKLKTATGKTYNNPIAFFLFCKEQYIKNGSLLYQDMFALAQECLHKNPSIKEVLQSRFPMVFLDEAQDTSFCQGTILEKLFANNATYQRLGDPNQEIFSFEKNYTDIFSRKSDTYLDITYRFNSKIAAVLELFQTNKLSINAANNRNDIMPKLLLFKTGEESKVEKKFYDILTGTSFGEKKDVLVKIVGGRGKTKEERISISSYIPEYKKKRNNVGDIKSIRIAAMELKNNNVTTKEYFNISTRFVLHSLKSLNIINDKKLSVSSFKENLKKEDKFYRFNTLLQMFLKLPNESRKKRYDGSRERLFKAIIRMANPNFNFTDSSYANVFKENCNRGTNKVSVDTKQIESFKIDIDTIHGVKGQTHDATLVLETDYYTQDISYFLDGEGRPRVNKTEVEKKRNPLYVAMSRPRYLLCVACNADLLSPETKATLSQENKWDIQEV